MANELTNFYVASDFEGDALAFILHLKQQGLDFAGKKKLLLEKVTESQRDQLKNKTNIEILEFILRNKMPLNELPEGMHIKLPKGSGLVFLGDLFDATFPGMKAGDANDLLIASILQRTRRQYPAQVITIGGNRDVNKMRIAVEITPDYREKLKVAVLEKLGEAFGDQDHLKSKKNPQGTIEFTDEKLTLSEFWSQKVIGPLRESGEYCWIDGAPKPDLMEYLGLFNKIKNQGNFDNAFEVVKGQEKEVIQVKDANLAKEILIKLVTDFDFDAPPKFENGYPEGQDANSEHLKWMLADTMGAPNAFANYKASLGENATDTGVFEEVTASVLTGASRDYLQNAKILALNGNHVFVHGAVMPNSWEEAIKLQGEIKKLMPQDGSPEEGNILELLLKNLDSSTVRVEDRLEALATFYNAMFKIAHLKLDPNLDIKYADNQALKDIINKCYDIIQDQALPGRPGSLITSKFQDLVNKQNEINAILKKQDRTEEEDEKLQQWNDYLDMFAGRKALFVGHSPSAQSQPFELKGSHGQRLLLLPMDSSKTGYSAAKVSRDENGDVTYKVTAGVGVLPKHSTSSQQQEEPQFVTTTIHADPLKRTALERAILKGPANLNVEEIENLLDINFEDKPELKKLALQQMEFSINEVTSMVHLRVSYFNPGKGGAFPYEADVSLQDLVGLKIEPFVSYSQERDNEQKQKVVRLAEIKREVSEIKTIPQLLENFKKHQEQDVNLRKRTGAFTHFSFRHESNNSGTWSKVVKEHKEKLLELIDTEIKAQLGNPSDHLSAERLKTTFYDHLQNRYRINEQQVNDLLGIHREYRTFFATGKTSSQKILDKMFEDLVKPPKKAQRSKVVK